MAITGYKILKAKTAAAMNTAVAAEIVAGNSPVGAPQVQFSQAYPLTADIYQSVAVGDTGVTAYTLYSAKKTADLVALVTAVLSATVHPLGGLQSITDPENPNSRLYFQATYTGSTQAQTATQTVAISNVTGLQTALNAKLAVADVTTKAGGLLAAATFAPDLLPIATPTTLGAVKDGSGVTVAGDGTLSVP